MSQQEHVGFVHLKDLSFTPYSVIAYSKTVIPQTMQTPQYPALTVWLRDVPQPVLIGYNTEEERDAEFVIITQAIAQIKF